MQALANSMVLLLLTFLGSGTPITTHEKRVLVLHEGTALMPYHAIASKSLRRTLTSDAKLHIDVFEEYFDSWRLNDNPKHRVEALDAKYAGREIDVVVADGAAAFTLLLYQPPQFLRGTPVVFLSVPDVYLPRDLPPNFTGIASHIDYSGTIALAEKLQPDLQHVFYVAGEPQFSTVAREMLAKEFSPFSERLEIVMWDRLALGQLLKQVSSLPPRSAVLYDSYNQDPSGQAYTPADVCALISASSNAPVYSPFHTMMGKGAVGGSMLNFEDISTRASEIVLALLRGAKVSDFPIEPSTNRITIDWKQLQKFRLPAKAVPSSAQILFQEPNVWNRYGWYIALGMVVFLLQSTLIIKLIIEGRKRKYSEASARQLAGRLIHAQEEERHRIARELHDDLSQRMAMVSIRVDTLRASPPDTENALVEQLTNIYEEADSISSEIHQLSHELHSTVLERLGLVAAIRHYCNEFSVHRRIPVSVQIDGEEVPLEKEIALVLFRVTQECLANTAKHSDATSCNLRLSYHNRRVELEVKDDGCGFAAGKVTQREGLGIESMRERLRSVGGTFQIRSKLSGGTTVCAEIPTGQATSGSATPKTTSNSPKAAAA